MKLLSLSNSNLVVMVDNEDFERVNQFTWFEVKTESSVMIRSKISGKSRSLSSFIMTTYEMYDHKDRDPYNNQKDNLREADHSQNMCNRRKFKNSKSPYKGITRTRNKTKWQVQLQVDGNKMHFGNFISPIEAAKAYDKAARKYHGEFANVNVPH